MRVHESFHVLDEGHEVLGSLFVTQYFKTKALVPAQGALQALSLCNVGDAMHQEVCGHFWLSSAREADRQFG